MKTVELLDQLRSQGVRIWLDGDSLRYRGPVDHLGTEVLDALRSRKSEIVEIIRAFNDERDALPLLEGGDRPQEVPLSLAQERLWFLEQLGLVGPAYTIAGAARIEGLLDVQALEACFNELVRRHESLRTRFDSQDGEARQVIEEVSGFRMEVLDLSGLDTESLQLEVQQIGQEAVQWPFDLKRGPLLRVTLAKCGERDHLVIVSMHHIISDGWSMGVLLKEVGVLYSANVAGQPSPLAPLQVQYADYTLWQRSWLQGEVLGKQLGYWKDKLAGVPLSLDLPTDHVRPPVQNFKGASVELDLTRSETEALAQLAREQRATMFMVLLAAFQVLLSRWSGQQDLVVGTPIAGRTHKKTEGLIGFFMNTLPLRSQLRPQMSFIDLLAQVKDTVLGAYAHQDVPFEKLVEILQPSRDLSRAAGFQALLALQNLPEPNIAHLPGVSMDVYPLDVVSSKLDLSLYLNEHEGRITGYFEYAAALFDRSTVERIARAFKLILQAAAADPRAAVDELPLVSEIDAQRQIERWQEMARSITAAPALHQIFARQAAAHPHATAVIGLKEALSYGDLETKANRLAAYLRARGVRRGSIVGLCCDRSPDMVASLLAIWKADAAFLPLDPNLPQARISYLVHDSGALLVLTSGLAAQALDFGAGRVDLADISAEISTLSSDAVDEREISVDAVAYVIYTSGSTGEPKGVMGTHLSLSMRVMWEQVQPDDVFVNKTTLSFIDSLWELFVPLTRGLAVRLLDDSRRDDLEAYVRELRALEPTRLVLVPSLLGALVTSPTFSRLQSLRECVCSGESLTATLATRFRELLPNARLVNIYGTSEFWDATAGEVVDPATQGVSIGQPFPYVRFYLLDKRQVPVPQGMVGEIFIAGPGVARGYLGRAKLTAERFLSDPFVTGSRMYRTGDFARQRSDGSYEFTGRRDDMVKLRGYRIELNEVTTALESFPGVARAAALLDDAEPGNDRLIGFIERASTSSVEAADVRTHAAMLLPAAAVPAQVVLCESLPRTISGKVDRVALRYMARHMVAARPVPPRTTTEDLLVEIWRDVLRLAEIGINQSFFEVGGHSLQAMRLISRIRDVTGVEISLREFLEAPVVEQLAANIDARLAQSSDAERLPLLEGGDRPQEVPLSLAQERLWFLEQLGLVGPAYTIAGAARIEGLLDVQALEACFNELVRRHESLRTRFDSQDGEARQVIEEVSGFRMEVLDLSGLDTESLQLEVQQIGQEAVQWPFDLKRGPLLRVTLAKCGERDHLVIVSMHHIISDGWSMGVLLKEVGVLYSANVAGQPSPLAPLQVQYADYTLWQRSWLQGEVLGKQLGYWKDKLAGVPLSLDLPTDHVRPPVQNFKGASVELDLTRSETEALAQLAREQRATMFMVLLAAFQVLLSRWSGQQDLVVGTPIAGRTHKKTEGLIGFFMNTLPLRSQLRPQMSFIDLLAQVKDTVLGAYAHQDVPFEKLVEILQPSRDLSRPPLVQVLINSLAHARPPIEHFPEDLRIERVPLPGEPSKFELTLFVGESIDKLSFSFVYAAELFAREMIETMLTQLRSLLAQIATAPDRSLDGLQLEPGRETKSRADALAHPEVPVGETIAQRVARWARDFPELSAITDGATVLDYRALDTISNRMARWLAANGVPHGALVAVLASRRAALPVVMLALQKVGASACTFDPAYPPARIAACAARVPVNAWVSLGDTADSFRNSIGTTAGDVWLHVPDDSLADVEWLAQYSAEAAPAGLTCSDVAFTMFTSGTTGQPQPVASTLGALTHFLEWQSVTFEFTRFDRFGLFAGLAHDPLLRDLFAPLWCCGHLALPPIKQETFESARWIVDAGLTVVHWTPSFAERVCSNLEVSAPLLESAFYAGENLANRHVQLLRQFAPNCRAVNFYGCTETPQAMGFSLQPTDHVSDLKPSLGRGIDGVMLEVTRPDGAPAGTGEVGEITVHTRFLSLGYTADPVRTAERFVPSPHGSGVRAYRTGDLGRLKTSGDIEYLGRRDLQVKFRGYRIELAAVESALTGCPEVAHTAVRVRREATGEQQLVAYFVEQPVETGEWIGTLDAFRAVASVGNPHLVAALKDLRGHPRLASSIEGALLDAPEEGVESVPQREWATSIEEIEDCARRGRSVLVPLSSFGCEELEYALGRYRVLLLQSGHATIEYPVALVAFAHAATTRGIARSRAMERLKSLQENCPSLFEKTSEFASGLDTRAIVGSASDCATVLRQVSRCGADLVLLCNGGVGDAAAQEESVDVLREAARLGRQTVLVERIRARLAAELPASMIPTRFIAMEELPLTPNGKFDENALPVPSRALVAGVSEFVAPRTRFERDLAAIWCEVLSIGQVSIYDNFFDIGGHSLLLNQVAARIRSATGMDVPLRMLFEAPTIAELTHQTETLLGERNYPTAVVADESFLIEDTISPLTLLQLGDSSALFLFHALNGALTPYKALMEELGWAYTFYGFDALAVSTTGTSVADLSEIAREYVDEMLKLQPAGPYRLLGWSFGGVLAYECARRLRECGHEVALLALIDARVHDDESPEIDEFTVWKGFIAHLAGEVGVLAGYDPTELFTATQDDRFAVIVRHVQRTENPAWITTFTESRLRQHYHVFRRNLKALASYRAQPYAGRMVHFETIDQDDTVESPWVRHAQDGCDRVMVSGDHASVMQKPYVKPIADFLRPLMDGECLPEETSVYVRVENAEVA